MLRTGSSKSEHHMTAEHTKPTKATKASDVNFFSSGIRALRSTKNHRPGS